MHIVDTWYCLHNCIPSLTKSDQVRLGQAELGCTVLALECVGSGGILPLKSPRYRFYTHEQTCLSWSYQVNGKMGWIGVSDVGSGKAGSGQIWFRPYLQEALVADLTDMDQFVLMLCIDVCHHRIPVVKNCGTDRTGCWLVTGLLQGFCWGLLQ